MRAMATAVMLLTIALLASVPAPLLVGLASDALGAGHLGTALLLAPVSVVGAALLFTLLAIMSRRRPDPFQTNI